MITPVRPIITIIEDQWAEKAEEAVRAIFPEPREVRVYEEYNAWHVTGADLVISSATAPTKVKGRRLEPVGAACAIHAKRADAHCIVTTRQQDTKRSQTEFCGHMLRGLGSSLVTSVDKADADAWAERLVGALTTSHRDVADMPMLGPSDLTEQSRDWFDRERKTRPWEAALRAAVLAEDEPIVATATN